MDRISIKSRNRILITVKKSIKTTKIYKALNPRANFTEKIPFINFVYTAIFINLINIISVLVLQNNLPPQVPLLYGFTESEQQLTTSMGLIIPGAYSLSLVAINLMLSIFLNNDHLKKVLNFTSFTISLLSAITVAKIILLVGYF